MSASMIVSAGLGNSSRKDLVESNACLHGDVVRDKLTGNDEFCYTILPSFGKFNRGYCDRLSSLKPKWKYSTWGISKSSQVVLEVGFQHKIVDRECVNQIISVVVLVGYE